MHNAALTLENHNHTVPSRIMVKAKHYLKMPLSLLVSDKNNNATLVKTISFYLY